MVDNASAVAFGALALLAGTPTFATSARPAVADFVQDVWQASERTLPHPGVTSFLQTRDGYLWIGTYAGVTRFDGVQFERPRGAKGALIDHTKCSLQSADGAIWFGTRREGVVRLKDGTTTFFTTKQGLASNDIRSLAVTADGTLWIATAAGLNAVEPGTDKIRTYTTKDGLPTNALISLYTDRDGSVWIGATEFGLARMANGKIERLPFEVRKGQATETPPVGMAVDSVSAIMRDAAGVMWVGTTVGLARLGDDARTAAFHELGAISGLIASREGGLWVATGNGLARIVGGEVRRYSAKDGLLHDLLLSAYEDSDGSLWMGTRIGMSRLRPRIIRTYTEADGLANDLVICVLETRDGDLWAGSRSGLSRLHDGKWKTYGVADGLPHASVRGLAEGPDGTLWIGTLDGIARYKDGQFTRHRIDISPYAVRSMAFDANGQLFVGVSDLGVYRVEGDAVQQVLRREDICGANPNYVFPAADGALWVGGSILLARVQGGKVDCLKDPDVLARNDVRSIYADEGGVLWIGSIGGLARMEGKTRKEYAGESGPFGTTIYGLLDDGRGSLWASTPKGLFQIPKKTIDRFADTGAAGLYHSFGTADGMETPVGVGDGEPTAFRGRDGRLYFTTAGGLAVVDPSKIQLNAPPPRVYVERLRADHEIVELKTGLQLPPGTRDLQFGFTALSFVAPERVQFKYRLEGYDRGWIEGGDRRDASYTNLPPGKYRFHVIAANHNGIWNEEGAALEFGILPRLYQRVWFAPLCLAVVAGLVAGAYRLRISRLRATEIELKRRVDEEVAKVQVLSGMLPICSSCRRVREDTGYWRQIEAYVMEHSGATFSHGVCPECWDKMRTEHPDLPEYGRN
jgi:ligand-binding sensor domain-containing protein